MDRPNGRRDRQPAAASYDLPYVFGLLPTTDRPYPFNLAQYARLLFLRGRLQDGAFPIEQEGRYPFTQHQGILWIERDGDNLSRRPMDPN